MTCRQEPTPCRGAAPGGWWLPCDPRAVAQTTSWFMFVASATLIVVIVAGFAHDPQQTMDRPLVQRLTVLVCATVVPLFLVVAGVRAAAGAGRADGRFTLLYPVAAVLAILALDLLSRDGSAGPQFLALFALVHTAHHFHRVAAWLVCGLVIGFEVVTCLVLEPVGARGSSLAASVLVACSATWLVASTHERRDRAIAELARLATTDPLTALSTRSVVEEQVDALASLQRRAASLILLDVDHFKAINDTHGHPAGDQVLVTIAERLRAATREEDVVARLGGDELAVLLVDCPPQAAAERATRLVAEVTARPIMAAGHRLDVRLSTGTAGGRGSFEELYQRADRELYATKRRRDAGRDTREVPA